MTGVCARYLPELMDSSDATALMSALEKLFLTNLRDAWPAAFDEQSRSGMTVALKDVDIVVLGLDRIGAPAGASGARVFVAYFSHRDCGDGERLLVSPPLIVKLGAKDKLLPELAAKGNWPTVSSEISARLAFPIILDDDKPGTAVLIAPFRSSTGSDMDGVRNNVALVDLWGLLNKPDEINSDPPPDWNAIGRHVSQAVTLIDHAHRNNRATYSRLPVNYAEAFDRYLRKTGAPSSTHAKRSYIPRMIFGHEPNVEAFGRQWPNPVHVLQGILDANVTVEAAVGPVHGDLHPKNIVIGFGDAVHIIDFGWAQPKVPVVIDYLLLDINLRGVTLPSQIGQADIVTMADYLDPTGDISTLNSVLQPRAQIIRDRIWKPLKAKGIVREWRGEYLIPFFIVAYGLLVYLDAARNQTALIATILAAAARIER